MPSRFDEEGIPALTPELAEEVVARFMERQAERQRAEAREMERQAEVARVQELADLLGTTPDDVAQLAREVRQGTKAPRAEGRRVALAPKPRWPLHAAYLTALIACLLWGLACFLRSPVAGLPYSLASLTNDRASGVGLRFDPYMGGYVRDDMHWPMRFNPGETALVDPTLKPPPPGLKVTLVTPWGRKSLTGAAGKTPDTPQAAAQLREAIRSVVEYEEAAMKVDGRIPTVDYDKAPVIVGTQNWNGKPTYVGWHQIEITDGRQTLRRLLPDRRYAKDLTRFRKAFEGRLQNLSDAKFFPSQPPANLRPGSRKLADSTALPKGVALMVWDDRRTVWLRGSGATGRIESDALSALVRRASAGLIPSQDSVQVAAVYPGGESYVWWPTDQAPRDEVARRGEKAKELTDAISGALRSEAAVRPLGRITYGKGSSAPQTTFDAPDGRYVFYESGGVGYSGW